MVADVAVMIPLNRATDDGPTQTYLKLAMAYDGVDSVAAGTMNAVVRLL